MNAISRKVRESYTLQISVGEKGFRDGLLTFVTIDQCKSAQQAAQVKDFQTAVASTNIGPDPLFPDFDLICEG